MPFVPNTLSAVSGVNSAAEIYRWKQPINRAVHIKQLANVLVNLLNFPRNYFTNYYGQPIYTFFYFLVIALLIILCLFLTVCMRLNEKLYQNDHVKLKTVMHFSETDNLFYEKV